MTDADAIHTLCGMQTPASTTPRYGLDQHRFGVNYTPTRSWWYCWNDFSPEDIAADMDSIAELGADHIRIMLLWPFFQPNPRVVSAAHVERLHILMRLAAERQLDVCVSLFVGWLSGYAFKPSFQKDGTFYDLQASREPQELYVRTLAEAMRQHGNFLGFDLGNELNCCWQAPLETGDAWHRHMLALARQAAPQGIHVNGVDHNPWFSPFTFSPRCLAETQSPVALHGWTFFTGGLDRSQGDVFHPRCIRLLATMADLARAYAGEPRKPVWIQEFGMCDEWTDPRNTPRFLQETTTHAIRSGVGWFTWWSSHDLNPRFAFQPLEYPLGLIGQDRKIKPAGRAFQELARAYRGKPVVHPAQESLPPPPQVLGVDATWEWLDRRVVESPRNS